MKVNKATHYNPWLHSFTQALREGTALTALNAVAFIVALAGVALVTLMNRDRGEFFTYPALRYYFFPKTANAYLIPLMLELALAQGVRMFGFLSGRKSTTAWLSLGLTRSSLFWSRLAAGAAGTALPVVLGMLGVLAVNLSFFHASALILQNFLFLLAGLCVQALVMYAIVAAVCCATSTLAENIGYSFIILLLPTAVLTALNALMLHFLFGNGYGFGSRDLYGSFNPALVGAFAHWNPLWFMSQHITDLSYAQSIGGALRFGNGEPAVHYSWALPLAWLAAALAVVWIAHLLFTKRKAEKVGVPGSAKVISYASVLAASFFAFSVVFIVGSRTPATSRFMSHGVMLFVGGLSAAAAMCAMAFPLRLVSRPVRKSLLPLICGLAAMYTVVGLLSAGGLGFSSRVPDAGKVRSVTVTYHGMPLYMESDINANFSGYISSLDDGTMDVTLTDPADIAAVAKLHGDFIKAGRLMSVNGRTLSESNVYNTITTFVYTMTDGSVSVRSYGGATREIVNEMLALDNTAGVKKAYSDYILAKTRKSGSVSFYQKGNVFLWTPFFAQSTQIPLNGGKRDELLGCIVSDLAAQSVGDRYFPTEPEVCELVFSREDNPATDFGLLDTGRVYVMPGFTRTLSFLRENGFADALGQKKEIEYMGIQSNIGAQVGTAYYGYVHMAFPYFMSETTGGDKSDFEKNLFGDLLTDPAQQQEVLSHCHGFYMESDGGYFVFIKYKDVDRICKVFLPTQDAPDYVNQNVK